MKRFLPLKRLLLMFLMAAVFITAVPASFQAAKKKTTKVVDYTPAQVKNLKATAGEGQITLKWKKVSNATGYIIYSVDAKTGDLKKLRTIKKRSAVTTTFKNLTNNKAYSFVVSAYRTKNRKTYEGAKSAKVTATPVLKAPAVPHLKVYANNDSKFSLTWAKVKKATGYAVYMKVDGNWTEKTRTSAKTVTISGLENGSSYECCIRAYRQVGTDIVYSGYSNTVVGRPSIADKKIASIQTSYSNVTVKKSGNYTLSSGGTAYISTSDKMTTTTHFREGEGNTIFTCRRTSDGKTFKIRQSQLNGANRIVTVNKTLYSSAVAEQYVNYKGYNSESPYLIWVNLYTQRIYIFKGKQYNWKVIRTGKCTTGAGSTQTKAAVTRLRSKLYKMYFEDQYAYWATYFNAGLAFHSWIYNPGDNMDASYNLIGTPRSHGCIRLSNDYAKYIYYNLPSWKTTCVVY